MDRRLPIATTTVNRLWRLPAWGALVLGAGLLVGGCASSMAENAPESAPASAPPSAEAVPAPASASETAGSSAAIYTAAQAKRGEDLFYGRCAFCHQGVDFTGEVFMSRWGGAPAGELFGLMLSTMPADNPASLGEQDYADILAYFLSMNELPSGDHELPGDEDALNAIIIQPPAQ